VLSKKEEKELEQWKRMKSIGKKKYIWFNGIIKWGLPMAISMTIVLQMLDDGISLYSLSNQNFMRRLIINLIVFPLGGYVTATILWRKLEIKFDV
jgi:phosphate/sulfate permease